MYATIRPLLFKLDPEKAHDFTLKLLKTGLMPSPGPAIIDPALEVSLWGLKFPNPVGISGGFDKNAAVIGPVLKMGFGFVEAGTVTPKPQEGNPKPRVFRDPANGAVINRMGMPNKGMVEFQKNFEKFLETRPRPPGVVGINIGMNKEQTDPAKDYTALIQRLGPLADYLTVNISSPNTPGLRDQQNRDVLLEIISRLKEERKKSCGDHPPPLLIKLAPDLNEDKQEELARTVLEAGVDGLVLTNTTLERPSYLSDGFRDEKGGLSGQPVKDKSTKIIRNFYALTQGRLPIIGVGGISSGRDAYEKIKAGATLVQLYTGLVYEGPTVANSINKELLALLRADGYTSITQAVGKG